MNAVLEHTEADRRLQAADGPNTPDVFGHAERTEEAASFCRVNAALQAHATVEHVHTAIQINALQQREMADLRRENAELRGKVGHLLTTLVGFWNVRNMFQIRHVITQIADQYRRDISEWITAERMPPMSDPDGELL